MSDFETLVAALQQTLGALCTAIHKETEITLEVESRHLLEVCWKLKETPSLKFEMLVDICGVDYLHYGQTEWATHETTSKGFSRAVESLPAHSLPADRRFAVVYHYLSLTHNHRVRVRTYALGEPPKVPSVTEIWNSANWYEREAFDLFGILFEGHNDLRRLLTDYGFIGHPFRKDFPLIGNVEVRYDHEQKRVLYEPVQITPRVLVPKTIRQHSQTEQD